MGVITKKTSTPVAKSAPGKVKEEAKAAPALVPPGGKKMPAASPKTPNVSKASAPSFMKTGAAAHAALEEANAKAKIAQEASGKAFRFFIGKAFIGQDFDITFLDGDLLEDSSLNLSTWDEHFVQSGGKWRNFVCLKPDYCPICAAGNTSALVAAFTVIDHSDYVIEKGEKKGSVVTNQKKLFMAKRQTVAVLQKIAQKNGGLRGWHFQTSRSNAQSPSVGDLFQPIQKYSEDDLHNLYGKDKDGNWFANPLNYAEEAPYVPREDMEKLGVGELGTVVGSNSDVGDDVSSHL